MDTIGLPVFFSVWSNPIKCCFQDAWITFQIQNSLHAKVETCPFCIFTRTLNFLMHLAARFELRLCIHLYMSLLKSCVHHFRKTLSLTVNTGEVRYESRKLPKWSFLIYIRSFLANSSLFLWGISYSMSAYEPVMLSDFNLLYARYMNAYNSEIIQACFSSIMHSIFF